MSFYVYILIPRSNENWHYVGYTSNPEKRLQQHNSGLNLSTVSIRRRPFLMLVVKEFSSKQEAEDYEKRLKRSSSTKKRIIENFVDKVIFQGQDTPIDNVIEWYY